MSPFAALLGMAMFELVEPSDQTALVHLARLPVIDVTEMDFHTGKPKDEPIKRPALSEGKQRVVSEPLAANPLVRW